MARLPQNVSENSGLTENSTVTAIPFSAINIPLLSVCLDHQPMQRAVGICSVVRYHRPDRAPSCDLYATPSAPIDQNAGRTFAVGTKTPRSEEHTSELPSLMRISYAVFCLKKKKTTQHT